MSVSAFWKQSKHSRWSSLGRTQLQPSHSENSKSHCNSTKWNAWIPPPLSTRPCLTSALPKVIWNPGKMSFYRLQQRQNSARCFIGTYEECFWYLASLHNFVHSFHSSACGATVHTQVLDIVNKDSFKSLNSIALMDSLLVSCFHWITALNIMKSKKKRKAIRSSNVKMSRWRCAASLMVLISPSFPSVKRYANDCT